MSTLCSQRVTCCSARDMKAQLCGDEHGRAAPLPLVSLSPRDQQPLSVHMRVLPRSSVVDDWRPLLVHELIECSCGG